MKVGDTVRLKSGGPVMTVTAFISEPICTPFAVIGNNTYAQVSWIHEGVIKQAQLFPSALSPVDMLADFP